MGPPDTFAQPPALARDGLPVFLRDGLPVAVLAGLVFGPGHLHRHLIGL